MPARQTIAIDAMGGDFGPEVTIPGAALAAERHPNATFVFYGNQARIDAALVQHGALKGRSRVVHTDLVVAMDDKPSQAMRRGKGSSMWLAIEAVQKGEAHAAVSAGNTGALMAMAKLILRTLPGIERPAIAALWPTVNGECVVLDVGANIGASARQLADFALMGAAMARAIFHIERPTVGLLNVGVEEIKGAEEVKEAHALLKTPSLEPPFTYKGFVEGNEIGQGAADVVVVEGFAGNIALKTAEGTARQIGHWLKSALTQSIISKLGAIMAQGALRAFKRKMDPGRVNGGTFLGLNGIVIKSHGSADAPSFAGAVDLGYDMAESALLERLATDIDALHGKIETEAQVTA
ncbi:MAG TPA: phosphate acyltransferase PlsX [Hyphomicrobiaceae bacterium]|nr:phosphate acyltransferase PlsX [Hyphomicrobiaceae bacterium]